MRHPDSSNKHKLQSVTDRIVHDMQRMQIAKSHNQQKSNPGPL